MTHAAKPKLATALVVGLAMAASWLCSAADDYPTRAIKLIVPWPPGGTVAVRSRLVAQRLERALKQPVVVDNRPGASGTIGMQAVARSAPDGYTLAFGTGYELESWSAQQFADFVQRDRPRWAQIIKTAGIKPEQ